MEDMKVGYLIRRDVKESWVKDIEKKYEGPYVSNGPEYFHPTGNSGATSGVMSVWKHCSDAQKALVFHIEGALKNGVDLEKQWSYKVVKVTIIEEDV